MLIRSVLFVSLLSAAFVFDSGEAGAAHRVVDPEWHPATATWYGSADGDGSDAPCCLRGGEGCGACYKVRCLDASIWLGRAVTFIVTDECPGGVCAFGRTHFDLSGAAFARLAVAGHGGQLQNRGEISVVYRSSWTVGVLDLGGAMRCKTPLVTTSRCGRVVIHAFSPFTDSLHASLDTVKKLKRPAGQGTPWKTQC
ncbi:hypothetical protein OsJ_07671 [Oryza sativa Japonica Group]|uniref:Expansin-like EG45 domain-containing protein n=1 Tax=Oryza sativa subsp. japonica TaxID=39947 RepID=B9F1A9_ORYSJ|nr:hypothetical protein OsJ_07671 [Oryza sativa Japonica Group]